MQKDDAIEVVNDLIKNSLDGEYGFRACAEHAKAPNLRALFERRAEGCAEAAAELQQQVTMLGAEPDTSGSASAAIHRGWVAVKATLSGYTDLALLEECERGEDVALARYRKALKDEHLSPTLREIVQRQADGAQRNHDQIRDMRNSLREAAH